MNNSKSTKEIQKSLNRSEKARKNFYQTLSKELLREELEQREFLKEKLLDFFQRRGYQLISPAILENAELIKKVKPEISSRCFPVIDHFGNLAFLRPDLTIPIARIAAGKLSQAKRPLRACYSGSIFQRKSVVSNSSDTDQRKEIAQVGAEIIGFTDDQQLKAQSEILALLVGNLKKLELGSFRLVLSHTASLEKLEERIIDPESKHLDFSNLDLNEQILFYSLTGNITSVLKFIKEQDQQKKSNLISPEALLQIKEILKLEKRVFREETFILDLTLRPNRLYYDGLYFELLHVETRKVFGSGGLYRRLTSHFGKEPENAIGFSLDLDFLTQYSELKAPLKETLSLNYDLFSDSDEDAFLEKVASFLE